MWPTIDPPRRRVALYPQDARDASDLLRRADAAMYHAKHHRTGPSLYEGGLPRVA